MGILLSEAGVENAAAGTASLISMIVIYGAFFLVLYFFILRPQSKEKKRVAMMLAEMEVGDCVLTTCGFYGIIIDISEEGDTVIVEFGSDRHCRIPMEKSAISRIEKADKK